MKPIFFDSWAWIALADENDSHHSRAKLIFESYIKSGGIPITTDYVLSEVFTALRKRLSHETAVQFGEGIFKAVQGGNLRLENINSERINAAWELYKKYQDKPRISFTDFTSFAVMSELQIYEAFTGDKHFEIINLGFVVIKD